MVSVVKEALVGVEDGGVDLVVMLKVAEIEVDDLIDVLEEVMVVVMVDVVGSLVVVVDVVGSLVMMEDVDCSLVVVVMDVDGPLVVTVDVELLVSIK